MGYGVWDGRLTFSSYRKAQKIKNLERDPRVTCLIEDIGQSYDQIRGVSVRGTATMIDDPQVLIERARATDRSGNVYAAAAKPMEEMAAKRVLVVVEPERVLSWDHRHLGGKY
jgi:nitroimidazol reductase NimA-like FMN-containing flavoprotein (pyridoxamine 5'-phosphate oxidase superfamily)